MTRLNTLLSFLLTAMLLAMVIGCNNQASSTKNVGAIIESSLDIIVSEKSIGMSSNPGDYISANKQVYKEIVDLGQPAFQYLTDKFEQGSDNGLRQWIMAKACSDILGTKDPVKNWSSGKEWYQKYRDLKRSQANQGNFQLGLSYLIGRCSLTKLISAKKSHRAAV